jgi:hypothetical protein
MMKSEETKENHEFRSLRADFFLASREAKFLFAPDSGVYDLLSRLDSAAFTITNVGNLLKQLPTEQIVQSERQREDALLLWMRSVEPLEGLLAPYLNYHYAFTLGTLAVHMRKLWQPRWPIAPTNRDAGQG